MAESPLRVSGELTKYHIMCKIIGKSDLKSFVGYKIAIKRDNGYYSPYTGIKYTVGRVKTVNVDTDGSYSHRLFREYFRHYILYSPGMRGKTGVYKSLKDAQMDINNTQFTFGGMIANRNLKYALLKMELSGDLYDAKFNDEGTMVGNTIEYMEEI